MGCEQGGGLCLLCSGSACGFPTPHFSASTPSPSRTRSDPLAGHRAWYIMRRKKHIENLPPTSWKPTRWGCSLALLPEAPPQSRGFGALTESEVPCEEDLGGAWGSLNGDPEK